MNCVVVIPVFKLELAGYEEISLLQCKKVFSKYPIRLLSPIGLKLEYYCNLFEGVGDFGIISFSPKYFKSPQSYNRFMKSRGLYRALIGFDFFLMYHTDAFVFRDELAHWIMKDYDVIGAPIYEYDGTISPQTYLGAGNGGFSLHKISTALRVLNSFKKVYSFSDFFAWYRRYNWKGKLKHLPYFLRMALGLGGWSHHLLNYSKVNEDIFWAIQVPEKFQTFKVAPFEEAYKFSVEYNCKELLELNNQNLPFGCHLWYKGGFLDFWKAKIEQQGYKVEVDESIAAAQ